jgi:hypothetical protein
MFGSDNVCYRNENKGLSDSDSVIKPTELQAPCAGESSELGFFARSCRQCAASFVTDDGRRWFCCDGCAHAAKAATNRRSQSEHRDRNPDKELARQTLKNAILLGKVRRCTRCEACGGRKPTQAHHSDYSRPFYVTWLCRPCHARLEDGKHFGCGVLKTVDQALEAGATDAQQADRHAHVTGEPGQLAGGGI